MSGFAGGGCTRVSVATITNIVISDGSTWTTPARINGSATYFVPKQITTNPVTGDVIVIGNNSGQSALYVTGK